MRVHLFAGFVGLAALTGMFSACGSSDSGAGSTSNGMATQNGTSNAATTGGDVGNHSSNATSAGGGGTHTASNSAGSAGTGSASTSIPLSSASGSASNASSSSSAGGGGPTDGGPGGGVMDENGEGGPASPASMTTVGNDCTPPAQYDNLFISVLGQTQAASDAKIAAAWNQLFTPSNANTIFYTGPQSGEAYIEDVADQDVRTEGQSYGMMITLQLNHQTEFDELWAFAKHYMYQSGSGQYAWHVKTSGASAGATGGAPDGDEWFAAALVFAHYRWGDTSGKYNYSTEAQSVLNMVRMTDFDASYHLVRYYAGTSSNGTDGSYVLPAFYQAWACFDTANATFWNDAVTASRMWFHAAAGSNGVIGDQSSFTGTTTSTSGDDKLRCVSNIMSDHNFFDADPWQTMTYAPEYAMHESGAGGLQLAEVACDGLLGFGLPTATGKPFVQALWNANMTTGTERYYDDSLYMLSLLHVSGAFQLWY